MNHNIISVDSADLLRKTFEVLQLVFVNEQGLSEAVVYDDPNKSAHYFVAIDAEGNAMGTARWRVTSEGVKLERFAVLPAYRNKGLGRDLLKSICNDIRSRFSTGVLVYLNAQLEAVNLYSRQGFLPVGSRFLEANKFHQKMAQKL
tara:strand:- start:187 stop:624 length:438 start_codon:yes stop_codon:yes gene_type:complete